MTKLLLRLFVKDYKDTSNKNVRARYGVLSGAVGIFCNLLLCGAKIFAGIFTASVSILADGLNNLSDAGSSIVTIVGFRMAGKPADNEHPFGHGRIEYVSGLIISIAIIVMGIELIKTCVERIISPVNTSVSLAAVIILGAALFVKLWMGVFNRGLSKKISSSAIRATAVDSFSDVAATSAVLIAALLNFFLGWNIDAYIGVLVAVFILVSGIFAAKDCLSPLLGTPPDSGMVEKIKSMVLAHPEIINIHDLIVHNYGPGRSMISLHAEVPCGLDIVKGHDVIDNIEFELKEAFDCETTIHMDPIAIDDEFTHETYHLVRDIVREIDGDIAVHDLRVARGDTHTNIIFDVCVKHTFRLTDKELTEKIKGAIREKNPTYFAVVRIDKIYT